MAQEQLVAILAAAAEIRPGERILDVGCGVGASARYLAEHFKAQVTGINISEAQVKLARSMRECRPSPMFAVMDAEHVGLSSRFDVLWSIEAISHLPRKQECFREFVNLTTTGGRIAIVDWFKAENLDADSTRKYIAPIVRGMLLPELNTMCDYANILSRLGCRIITVRDISDHVTKTWEICVELTRLPDIWHFAFSRGSDFICFLRSFMVMKQAFRAGAFRCGLLIAETRPELAAV